MILLVTPAANELIYSSLSDPATLRLLGHAMRFEERPEYRQHQDLLQLDPDVKPIIYLRNGRLALRHMVTEDVVLLFIPPEQRHLMTREYLDKELAASRELNIL